jgi:hypothetical protein
MTTDRDYSNAGLTPPRASEQCRIDAALTACLVRRHSTIRALGAQVEG